MFLFFLIKMPKAKNPTVYGYFSHHHRTLPGCPVTLYLTPDNREVFVTETGPTPDPKDSGYTYPQTIKVGIIDDKWKILEEYTVPEPKYPEYLIDPEEPDAAA